MKLARPIVLAAACLLAGPFLLAAAQPAAQPGSEPTGEPQPADPGTAAPADPGTAAPADPTTPTDPDPGAMPDAEALFAKHVEAAGGMERIMAMRGRISRGVFEQSGTGPSRLTIWAEAPGKLHIRISPPLGGSIDICTDGETAWSRTEGNPPTEITGARKKEFLEAARFYAEAEYKTKYKSMRTVGRVRFNERPAWLVEVISHDGRQRRVAFDDASGLLVAELSTLTVVDAQGNESKAPVEVAIGEWTAVKGVSWPKLQVTKYLSPDDRTKVTRIAAMRINKLEMSEEPLDHDFSMPEPEGD